ncbi:hypothetical protein NKH18_01545 [Streptomyces sp. M10(2022)]
MLNAFWQGPGWQRCFPPSAYRPAADAGDGGRLCVEHGADPADCADPILGGVYQNLLDALEFARRWTSTCAAENELPEPDEKIIDNALLARLGGDGHEAARLALAWCSVEQWQPPALAVLCRSTEVRRRHASAILPVCRELASLERHDLKCLVYALAVLDDEPSWCCTGRPGQGSRYASAASGTTSSCTRCSPTSSSAAATYPALCRRRRASAWPPIPSPRRDAPRPLRPAPSSSSPQTASGSGTKGCPTTYLWWKDAACSCSTSRHTSAAGTPTASSHISRARPS